MSHSRRALRLQLGVNRKSTATRWMNGWVVGIQLSKMKAGEGAEKSFRSPHRRSRRGQRRGKRRARGGKPRCPALRPAKAKTPSPRVVNHRGRKFIWAQVTSSKLARLPVFERLEAKAEPYFGGAKWLDRRLSDSSEWRQFGKVYSPFRRRAKAMGLSSPVVEMDLWTFVQVWSSSSRSLEGMIDDLWFHLGAPSVTGDAPGPALQRQVCRSCGYVGPSDSHSFGRCRPPPPARGRGRGARSNRRSRGTGRGSRPF
jgi:hypothetical protein